MSDDDLTQRIEKLRNILVSEAFNRKKKVRVLRRVMELRDEPRVCALIREAARLPVNERMLGDFVRVLGYLADPVVLEDLAGYIAHPRKLVASNAVKAAVSFDPVRAVEMVLRSLRTAPVKNLSAAMQVLAERCPRETGPAVEKMLVSRSRRDRLLAVIFLSHARDIESADLLLDLVEVEREAAVIELAFQALDRQASQANRARIEELQSTFAVRAEHLRDLLDRLPEKPLGAAAPHTRSRKLLPIRPATAPVSGDSTPELLRVPRPAPPEPPPDTPAPTSSGAQKLLPWQEKELKIRARRAGEEPSVPVETAPRWPAWQVAVVGLLIATVVVTGLAVTHGPPAQTAAPRVVDVKTSPLGAINAKVNFVATVTEIHADYNTMLVRSKEGVLASVRFPDSIASFAPGKSVEIAGTIREIRGGGICVLDGITARQL